MSKTYCSACGLDWTVDGHAEGCGDRLNDADSPLLADGTMDGDIDAYLQSRTAR